jgi:ADP-L-glycero-D-manno-heptose 6-epimerase
MDGLKIIITGSVGFIGSNLKNHLLNDKTNIIYEINEDFLLKSNWQINLFEMLNQINPDIIFHVGACSNTLENDINYIMSRNVEFSKIVCDFVKIQNTKLIFSSSASVYGTDNLSPSNLYGWTKYISEKFVIDCGGISLRYFNVYGPGEEHKKNMASVAYQFFLNKKSGKSTLLFPNKPKRDFIYIKDVIDANIFAMENYSKFKGSFYEVGTSESHTFEEVMAILGISFDYQDSSKIPTGYQQQTCSNKNLWMNGWHPKYNIYSGLIEYKNYLTTKF